MFNIKNLDRSKVESIQNKINQKTKPIGALGRLEDLASQLARILIDERSAGQILISNPLMLVFAGDHGIAKENVSIASSKVTQQMVVNFLNGGAAINCFCETNNMSIQVIDAGILLPIDDERLVQQSLGNGTNNFLEQSAMSMDQVEQGIQFGKQIVEENISRATNVFGFGEMGIANTSSATAIQSLLMGISIDQCVGRGTGISDKMFLHKKQVLLNAMNFHTDRMQETVSDPMEIMAAVGGFEIVQMVGAMLSVAENNRVMLIDGYIATAAAMLAVKMYPNSRDYMIFCHQSDERGHKLMLEQLVAEPLLDLGLRLGEGTGAALALPLILAAANFYNNMASFESAGVTDVVS
ncbi:MAG: nicotinate-nucleotide--dimethylbenzimidazole phosphoribosyltransferase [Kangiellaceae bacterium]|nr:nicotinate-nucleotide--dimethylbenzimidazole phosphoribosyltransferase [Kangiellaceae bacterium]